MNDDLQLLDDPLDDGVQEFLAGLDRGPRLTVDVDEAIAAGARRRHVHVAERVLAVAATAAVVVGVAVFAVARPSTTSAPPTTTPTARPVAPSAQDWAWYMLGDRRTRTGLAVASVKNTSGEPITVLAPVVTGDGGVRAVLTGMIPADPKATVVGLEYLAKVDQPAPSSVVLPPGRSLLVVMAVPAACERIDQTTSTQVALPLRSSSGLTGSLELGSRTGVPQSWELVARKYACPSR